jgi:hypothetical protein
VDGADSLTKFQQTITKDIPPPLLEIPAAHQQAPRMQSKEEISKEDRNKLAARCSPRFKNNTRKHKSAIKLAEEVIAKKWDIIEADNELEELTLQQYFDQYRKPLSQPAMMAIKKLSH